MCDPRIVKDTEPTPETEIESLSSFHLLNSRRASREEILVAMLAEEYGIKGAKSLAREFNLPWPITHPSSKGS